MSSKTKQKNDSRLILVFSFFMSSQPNAHILEQLHGSLNGELMHAARIQSEYNQGQFNAQYCYFDIPIT